MASTVCSLYGYTEPRTLQRLRRGQPIKILHYVRALSCTQVSHLVMENVESAAKNFVSRAPTTLSSVILISVARPFVLVKFPASHLYIRFVLHWPRVSASTLFSPLDIRSGWLDVTAFPIPVYPQPSVSHWSRWCTVDTHRRQQCVSRASPFVLCGRSVQKSDTAAPSSGRRVIRVTP